MIKKKPINPVLQRILSRLEVQDKETLVEMRKELITKQKQIKQTIKALNRSLISLKMKLDNEPDKQVDPDNELDPKLKKYLLKRVKVLLET